MGETEDGLHRVIEILSETDLSGYLSRIRDDLQVTKYDKNLSILFLNNSLQDFHILNMSNPMISNELV